MIKPSSFSIQPALADAGRRMAPALVIATTAALVTLSTAALSGQGVSGGGLSPLILVGLVPPVLLAAWLLPASVPLILTVVFLESPLPAILDNRPSAYVTTGLLAWTALASFISVSRPRETVVHPLLGKFWFLAAYGIVSALWGLRFGNPAEYVVGDLFQIEEFALIFILVVRVVVDDKTLWRLLLCGFGSTLFTALWQLGYAASGDPGQKLAAWEGSEISQALPRTINLDAIFILLVLLSIYPILKSSRQRFWAWFLLVPIVANLLLSFTRGIWLAAMVAMAVGVGLLEKNERWKLLRTMAVATACLAIVATVWKTGEGVRNNSLLDAVKDRLSFGMTQVEHGFEGNVAVETRRFVELTTIAPQILPSPLLGKGLGGMYWIDALAFVKEQDLGTIDYHYMHNLYLLVGFRMGLIGLFSFVGILYSYFREGVRACGRMPGGLPRALTAGLIAGVAGQVVLSMSSPTILNHPTSGLTACVMALTFRLESLRPDSPVSSC
jgi:O-antigen ligase